MRSESCEAWFSLPLLTDGINILSLTVHV